MTEEKEIKYYLGDKKLLSYKFQCKNEAKRTLELLAFEHKVEEADIKVYIGEQLESL